MFYFQFDFDYFRNLGNKTNFYIIHFTLSIFCLKLETFTKQGNCTASTKLC